MQQFVRAYVGGFLILLLASLPAAAQATAQLGGTVRDESGGILPGVTVTATQTDTGFSRSVVTDASESKVTVLGLLVGLQCTVLSTMSFLLLPMYGEYGFSWCELCFTSSLTGCEITPTPKKLLKKPCMNDARSCFIISVIA